MPTNLFESVYREGRGVTAGAVLYHQCGRDHLLHLTISLRGVDIALYCAHVAPTPVVMVRGSRTQREQLLVREENSMRTRKAVGHEQLCFADALPFVGNCELVHI